MIGAAKTSANYILTGQPSMINGFERMLIQAGVNKGNIFYEEFNWKCEENLMIKLYEPKLEELSYLEALLGDEETMAYNEEWGGTIEFPQSMWDAWYEYWIENHDDERFYRYLQNEETGEFVGEVAYHYDDEVKVFLADVKVHAKHRSKGFGQEGLNLLCEEAKKNGIKELYDEIAIDNQGINLFLKNGFEEEYRTEYSIVVKKVL